MHDAYCTHKTLSNINIPVSLPIMFMQKLAIAFYAPDWKVHQGHLIIGSSICLFGRNSVPLTDKVQYLKFWWSYSNQTWTVSSSKGCSHLTDIKCPTVGVGMWDFDFARFWLCCRRRLPCFTNTCLVCHWDTVFTNTSSCTCQTAAS